MLRAMAAGLLALTLAGPLAAKTGDQVTTFTLKNGMQVVVIEDHRAPVVVNMVWYRAGAGDEKPGVSGIAHFLEHLMFKGTDTMAPGELSKVVAANGGSDNAFTTQDYTAYFQRVAADRLGLMMKMEADRMVNLRLPEDQIDSERDVILEERNQRVDNNPGALFSEQRNAAQYLNSPYGTPVIGWRREMKTLSRQDALDFYHEYYAPNDAIAVIAGDVTPEGVRKLAEKHYGPIAANPDLPVRSRPQEPVQRAARRLKFSDPRVAQPYVVRTYLAPERNHGDQKEAAALTLLAKILGGGQTSLMTEKLQFDKSVAVYSSASYSGVSLDETLFNLIVVPVPGVSLQAAEDAMDGVLRDFMQNGVDPDQLKRIKMQVKAAQIYARDDVQGLANQYGRALASSLTVEDVQDWPDILESVTPDDIMQAARDVFDPNHSVTGWLQTAAKKEAAK